MMSGFKRMGNMREGNRHPLVGTSQTRDGSIPTIQALYNTS